MVAHVFVTEVFVGAVAAASEPVQRLAKAGVVLGFLEQSIMSAVMYQVGGDDHPMAAGQDADNGQKKTRLGHKYPATDIGREDVGQHKRQRPDTV